MPIDKSNRKDKAKLKQGLSWELLVQEAKQQISDAERQIKRLRRSIRFFEEQAATGSKFPVP